MACFLTLCLHGSAQETGPGHVVMTQLNWYLGTLRDTLHSNFVTIETTSEGNAHLNASRYLSAIEEMNMVTPDFIASERSRTSGCNYLMKKVTVGDVHALDIQRQCDFVYLYHWIYCRSDITAITVRVIFQRERRATAEAYLVGDASRSRIRVDLIKHRGLWRINNMTRIDP
jgi:hypothetical protein